ncbi:unnamed protein product [Cladocopium goreaui]|uniref:Uncharacterized protein n=1 Tax=Cladocopium goreaui TaxID=2562237 RepID=A0A9P1G6V9_9DINO|nr:unnamed protein product [Cladocopium goreaui]
MMSGGPLARRPGSGSALERGGQAQLAQMQIFSGGVARSERALVAGTDGSVEQVQSNIAKAVQAFGPTPGGKKMMQAEKLAAEEAIRTGLYGVWRNAASGHDFCGRIGPSSRCLCGHEYSSHVWSKGRKELRPACGSCSCTGFRYIPRRPEEIGEWWLPRRKGFDIRIWRPKCKCQHSHEEHDPNTLSCRCCGCHSFSSAWECITCEGKWEDHESLWENEEERRLLGKPIGQAFMPLASTPDIQQMVLQTPAQLSDDQGWSLPYRSKPERSVRLMQERCSNYGRNNSRGGGQGSLEDAFPPRPPRGVGSAGASQAASGFTGGLEDAFPPRQRSNSGGRLR